jgi:ORF 12 gene product N-terminal
MAVELPKTPVGRHLGWVLDALREAPTTEDVRKRFSTTFLLQTPATTLVQTLELRAGELRGFVLDHFAHEAQRDLEAILRLPNGASYRLAIAVDDQRITSLVIRSEA